MYSRYFLTGRIVAKHFLFTTIFQTNNTEGVPSERGMKKARRIILFFLNTFESVMKLCRRRDVDTIHIGHAMSKKVPWMACCVTGWLRRGLNIFGQPLRNIYLMDSAYSVRHQRDVSWFWFVFRTKGINKNCLLRHRKSSSSSSSSHITTIFM